MSCLFCVCVVVFLMALEGLKCHLMQQNKLLQMCDCFVFLYLQPQLIHFQQVTVVTEVCIQPFESSIQLKT